MKEVKSVPLDLNRATEAFLNGIPFGNAGPDMGKGGKFLILPPGYESDVPDGYHVARTPTFGNYASGDPDNMSRNCRSRVMRRCASVVEGDSPNRRL